MNEVIAATNSLSAFIGTESIKLFLGVFVPGIMKYSLIWIRKLLDIQSVEKNSLTEKRAKVLSDISAMASKRRIDVTKNAIKAMYESIGMYYSNSVNKFLLTYLRVSCITYDDRDFQAFIKTPVFSDIQTASVKNYNVKYRQERKQKCIFSFIVFVIFLAAFMFFAGMAKNSTGSDKVFFIIMAVIFYLLPVIFSFLMMNEFDRSRRARVFYKKFAPWYQQKLTNKYMSRIIG